MKMGIKQQILIRNHYNKDFLGGYVRIIDVILIYYILINKNNINLFKLVYYFQVCPDDQELN
jgi:hypothetical protein